MKSTELTSYQETVAPLISQLREAAVDFEAFERRLPLCDLSQCRATCCHDGAVVSSEEAGFLAPKIQRLPDGRFKTQVTTATKSQRAVDFPAHFSPTRCVFLDEEHRCSWQLKSVSDGKHPWYYKPVSCWMHPILVKIVNGRPVLTVVSPENDQKGFASCTPCGSLGKGGQPARITLRMELEMLSNLSGRNFLRELNAPTLD